MRSQTDVLIQHDFGLKDCLDCLEKQKNESRPRATYRLQFHKDFKFTDALKLVPYLKNLGVSHIYASPILKARAGSMHGYDITDHNVINPEIGTEEEFATLVADLKRNGMGIVLDTVPNHMGTGQGDNPWWQDVLENGRAAEHADFFDIDWKPLKPELENKILLPILGEQYGVDLEEGRIKVDWDDDTKRFVVRFYDKTLPIDPQTVPLIFVAAMERGLENQSDEFKHFLQALSDLALLPPNHISDPALAWERREHAPKRLATLAELFDRHDTLRSVRDEALTTINGTSGDARSFDSLHRLLEAQAYRLAYWRVSAEEINYRRFFDVNELIGVRMENPKVFAATHKLLRKLIADGAVDGIRIDHSDGLLNPRQYLIRAQMLNAAAKCVGSEPMPPLAENGIEEYVQSKLDADFRKGPDGPLYCVVEKILEPGEELPTEWPVAGTSGYDFANLVNGLFIQQKNEKAFTNLYHRVIGEPLNFDLLLYQSKKLIMNTALSSEVNVLTHLLDELSCSNRRARDYTRKVLRDAIREVIACFPVYRSYIDERGMIDDRDRSYIFTAIKWAKRRNAGTASAVFDFLKSVLTLEPWPGGDSEDIYRQKLHFTLKFQQLTGPVMAKGLEDTAFYIYNRFISSNEVGGSPKHFGTSLEEFHDANLERAKNWPFAMLATSTHDTKRSEDVRARLNVLSEMPREWSTRVLRWRRLNNAKKHTLSDGRIAPDNNEEYLLYQTLVGAWPFAMESDDDRKAFTERIAQYMHKALHEAKVNVSWINQNEEYSNAVRSFIEAILQPGKKRTNFFLKDIQSFLPAIQYFGTLNSIAQQVLKLTAPGIPDIYQGTELFDFSLVDPDNRRPVDFDERAQLMEQNESLPLPHALMESLPQGDGRLKLLVTSRILNLRSEQSELFRRSEYREVAVVGEKREHIIAFERKTVSQRMIVAVPRFTYTLMNGRIAPPVGDTWKDAGLMDGEGRWRNVLNSESHLPVEGLLHAREIFRSIPFAVLIQEA